MSSNPAPSAVNQPGPEHSPAPPASHPNLAEAHAAAAQAYRDAQSYQDQGQGVPVPEADSHPLTPGNGGRRST